MIYIRDYRSLNSLINNNNNSSNSQNVMQSELMSLIGRIITVFVDSGSISGGSFTGILIEVLSDSIKLVARPPSNSNISNSRAGYNISYSRKIQSSIFSTKIVILIKHITALAYNNKWLFRYHHNE